MPKLVLPQGDPEAELKDARNRWLQGRNVSRSQDRKLVGRLQSYLYLDRSIEWDAAFEDKVAKLSLADVNAAVKRWIKPADLTIVEAGGFPRKALTDLWTAAVPGATNLGERLIVASIGFAVESCDANR